MSRTLLMLLAVLLLPAVSFAAQTPAFSAGVEAIRVDVLVTDRGGIVRGLQPTDFEVRDNGVIQQVDFVSLEKVPLNVVLALDISGSLTPERLRDLRHAGGALLDALTANDRSALITFSHMVSLATTLTNNHADVRAALERPEPGGDTALVDAAHTAMVVGESGVGRTLLVVFSDGLDTASWLSPADVLETARGSEVVAYTVTADKSYRSEFLDDLTESTGGRVLRITSTGDLKATFVKILDEFRHRYLLTYSPRGVAKDGWHRLSVRLKGRNGTIKARNGYWADR